jgi:hypothetical protein
VHVSRGSDKLKKYSTPDDVPDPDTGVIPNSAFCSECGCPVWCQYGQWTIVRFGLLDFEGVESEWEMDDGAEMEAWKPSAEFFTSRKVEWARGWCVDGAVQRRELSQ